MSPRAASDFTDLLRAHRGIVYKIAASYGLGYHDREDLAQEIAAALWRAWPSYDPARPFSTWMYRVALNVAISHQRRSRHRDREVAAEHAPDAVGAQDVDIEARQRVALLQQAIRLLSPLNRALLLLQLDGCSQRECAEVLGTSEGNVATRLGRIKDQLRRTTGGNRGDGNGTR
ncbi:sigma-70 family RNA polymerase sigma factor [Xanthomonas sp. 3498]|uniref:sigma-70 family RNA polymerase sigma factor n=1 Tax=Xanthomonas sp. 3498 TaxID=2663863 RepID=UPI00161FE25A|nr:sigma-70 family RNA polymerase sigma factor [Xanthomonas sp. 3498]MBB5877491.1 RNA polymerase sigma-70 factor (ECF subfamily) [Xanthomonas sp. 3498]